MEFTALDERLDLAEPIERSDGIHLTDCTRRAAMNLGLLDPDTDDTDIAFLPRIQLGHALEHSMAQMLERRNPGRYAQLGELWCGGIYFTPDLVDFQPPDPSLGRHQPHEIKLTWMSPDHTPDSAKWWLYRAQLMGQCWGLRSLTGVMRVVYVMSAQWKPVRFVWSYQELAEHWAMLRSVARMIARERGIDDTIFRASPARRSQ